MNEHNTAKPRFIIQKIDMVKLFENSIANDDTYGQKHNMSLMPNVVVHDQAS
jgi:hypothetical protein